MVRFPLLLLIALSASVLTGPSCTRGRDVNTTTPVASTISSEPRLAPIPDTQRSVATGRQHTEPDTAPSSREFVLAVRSEETATKRRVGTSRELGGHAFEVGTSARGSFAARILARGELDENGFAEVSLPAETVASIHADEGQVLWARLSDSAMLQTRNAVRAHENEPHRLWVSLPLHEGATLRGRLFDSRGEPARGWIQGFHATSSSADPFARCSSDANGFFELHADGGDLSSLRAVVEGGPGAGNAALLLPAGALPAQDLELRVRGPGVLRGRVIGDDGVAAAGLRVHAIRQEIHAAGEDSDTILELESRYLSEGLGLLRSSTTTDSDGRFAIHGLHVGSYQLFAEREQTNEPLTQRAVLADGRVREYRCSRPHVVVRVRDEEGAFVEIRPLARGRSLRRDPAWPASPSVHVTRIDEAPVWRTNWDVQGRPLTPTALVYELEKGRYRVTLLASGGTRHREIEIEPERPGGSRFDLTLDLPRPAPLGTLALEIVPPADHDAPLRDVAVRLYAPGDGVRLVDHDITFRKPGRVQTELDLPAGEYRLVVEDEHTFETYHGTVVDRRSLGRFEQAITIRSGERTGVAAELSRAARIELTLNGSVQDEDCRALVDLGWNPEDVQLRIAARDALVVLIGPSGDRWPVYFQAQGWFQNKSLIKSTSPLGTTAVSEALPPGRFVLQVVLRGGRSIRHEVQLVPSETLPVTLDFGP